MTTEQNKKKEKLMVEEVLNKGRISVMDEILTKDFVYHGLDFKEIRGIEAYKQFITDLRTAYPDFQVKTEDIIAEKDIVATRYTAKFTFTGKVKGIEPTGRSVEMKGVIFERFEDGKIAETWEYYDQKDVQKQLGINQS